MKNLLAIIIGAIIFFVCATHLVPSHEPASTLQWWTYGMFGGLGLAAAGVYGLKKRQRQRELTKINATNLHDNKIMCKFVALK